MAGERRTREELREAMLRHVNRQRDVADEAALMFDGCDDPTHPHRLGEFRDWVDFVDRVARPLVEADDDRVTEQEAMRLYRQASPFSVCVALVMAANRAETGESHRWIGDHPAEAVAALIDTGVLEQVGAVQWVEEGNSGLTWAHVRWRDDATEGSLRGGELLYRVVTDNQEDGK